MQFPEMGTAKTRSSRSVEMSTHVKSFKVARLIQRVNVSRRV